MDGNHNSVNKWNVNLSTEGAKLNSQAAVRLLLATY